MRRKILLGLTLVLLMGGAAFWWWTRPLPVLTVTTWAGVYGRAQAAAQMQPYGIAHRVNVRIAQWSGDLDEIRRAVKTSQYTSDVYDLELPAAITACREGLLEPLDPASLPPGADGTPAAQDFYRGMTSECFVASAIYAQMIVCDNCEMPADIGQVFGAVAQGAKIALQRSARVNLEMALLADGVAADQVYATLATPEGVARAFARLDTIKANIVWWDAMNEPVAMLKDGRAQFAAALTASVAAAEGLTILPQQFYEADVLAVPRGTPRKEMALDYVKYATGSAPLAGIARFAPFMPPRRSSMALVQQLPPAPEAAFVLSQKGMMEKSFAIDNDWWREHGDALQARFRFWAMG